MSKIENSKPKSTSNLYASIIGDEAIASVMTRIQSTAISCGRELEKIVTDLLGRKYNVINDITQDQIEHMKSSDWVITPGTLRKSKMFKKLSHFPDYVFFKNGMCYIIELKSGAMFDSKKSDKEWQELKKSKKFFSSLLGCPVETFVCTFSAKTKEHGYIGCKKRIPCESILTGRDMCKLFNISYSSIIHIRNEDQKENMHYLVKELMSSPVFYKKVMHHLTSGRNLMTTVNYVFGFLNLRNPFSRVRQSKCKELTKSAS